MVAHDWDGMAYDRISTPLEQNGISVLARLPLAGDETVLDAGCGSGRVTQALIARLPRGRVIAVDGSAGMLRAARARLGDEVELIHSELTEIDLGGRTVDVVFSTAVFHWIADHPRLFARLRGLLGAGGRLFAQCGGEGNTPELLRATLAVGAREPYAPYLEGFSPWYFAGPGETAVRLAAAGFEQVHTRLALAPPPFGELHEWLRVNALSAHQLRLPEALRAPYVDHVHEAFGGDHRVTYVRLDIDARAPA
jgi:trans-aconitate 2-methyltransferase